MLFQIKDDLLDYEIKSSSGKPNFQDIKEKRLLTHFTLLIKMQIKFKKNFLRAF